MNEMHGMHGMHGMRLAGLIGPVMGAVLVQLVLVMTLAYGLTAGPATGMTRRA